MGDTPKYVQSRKKADFSYKKASHRINVTQGSWKDKLCLWEPWKPVIGSSKQRFVISCRKPLTRHWIPRPQGTAGSDLTLQTVTGRAVWGSSACSSHLFVLKISVKLPSFLDWTWMSSSIFLKPFAQSINRYDCVVRTAGESCWKAQAILLSIHCCQYRNGRSCQCSLHTPSVCSS